MTQETLVKLLRAGSYCTLLRKSMIVSLIIDSDEIAPFLPGTHPQLFIDLFIRQVPEEVLSVLRQFFAPHNRKFFAMVGQEFDWPEQ